MTTVEAQGFYAHVDLWSVITWAVSIFISIVIGFFVVARMMLNQYQSGLDTRFEIQEVRRQEAKEHWNHLFSGLQDDVKDGNRELQEYWEKQFSELSAKVSLGHDSIQELKNDLYRLKVELPVQFVTKPEFTNKINEIESSIKELNNAEGR